jgi:hypothetical protein
MKVATKSEQLQELTRRPHFPIEKGECLDSIKGEYSGVNESAKKKSLGEVKRIWLYTAFEYPHTSCGCFEGIAFYIPEVEGFGIVHRGFQGLTGPEGRAFYKATILPRSQDVKVQAQDPGKFLGPLRCNQGLPPCPRVRVHLNDGKYHVVDSKDIAFLDLVSDLDSR